MSLRRDLINALDLYAKHLPRYRHRIEGISDPESKKRAGQLLDVIELFIKNEIARIRSTQNDTLNADEVNALMADVRALSQLSHQIFIEGTVSEDNCRQVNALMKIAEPIPELTQAPAQSKRIVFGENEAGPVKREVIYFDKSDETGPRIDLSEIDKEKVNRYEHSDVLADAKEVGKFTVHPKKSSILRPDKSPAQEVHEQQADDILYRKQDIRQLEEKIADCRLDIERLGDLMDELETNPYAKYKYAPKEQLKISQSEHEKEFKEYLKEYRQQVLMLKQLEESTATEKPVLNSRESKKNSNDNNNNNNSSNTNNNNNKNTL